METESATTSEDLHRRRHSHSNHSRHSSGGNNNNNNNNNNINININSHQVEPDLSSEDGDFGSADEIGSEEASAWIARASRSLCEDSQGAAGVGGGLVDGGLGVGVGAEDGSSPPLQGEVNVTLWQFLLELLMSRQYSHVIQWTNREGEFQLLRAEEVARLWGMRKNKNHRMNYDKLSRALRYYYQKNIIKKVQGQKFVYRFVGLSESALRASRTLGAAAAAAAIAAPPDGVCSPKLEAVEDDSPATPPLEEPSTPQAQPLLLQQTQPQTPPHQPAALAQARRLWQGGQLLQHQHHHQPHQQQHQQQHQGLDLSLPHAAAAAVAAVAAAAAAASPASVSAGAAALSSSSPPFSKRHRTPEAAIRSPESPPAKRPCCSCRCHEPQPQLQTSPLNAAVSTPRVKSEPTTVASAMEPGESLDTDGGGGDLPGNYIQWLTLELAGSGGAGGGGPAYLHSTRHAANMKKLAEHIRLHKLLKRPEPAAISAPTSSATSAAAAAAAAAAASHSLRHPHPPPPPHASGLASSMGNGSPFSPPGCVWMPVPVAMLSQLWAGHEAAAAAVAAASAAAAAAAAAAAPSSSSSGGGAGDIEDQGD